MIDINTVPLLKNHVQGKHYDDLVCLCINHDLSNNLLLGYYLGFMFHELTYVAVPYSDGDFTREYRALQKKCYHAKKVGDVYQLFFNEKPMKGTAPDVPYAMDTLITYAVATDILPKIREGKKLVIVEDGGHHSAIVDNLLFIFPELEGKIVGSVEQTTSGTRIAAKKNISTYPQISVARSNVKMNFESVFIGQSIISELNAFLRFINLPIPYRHVLIIGYGIVGRSLKDQLQGYKCKIDVYDIDERIRKVARADGLNVFDKIDRSNFNEDTIVLGCVGDRAFTVDMLKAFMESDSKNLYLCSGSSGNIEFKDFIELTNGDKSVDGITVKLTDERVYSSRYSVQFNGVEKSVVLIAGGLPVNMVRSSEQSVPDGVMDIVFAQMADCTKLLCEPNKLENKLYLLGDVDTPFDKAYELDLIKSWFEVNRIDFDGNIDALLDSHPETDYLRSRIISLIKNKLT